MTTIVGRLRPCAIFDWKFTVLSHNTIRGAAGAAILNAELLKAQGISRVDAAVHPHAGAPMIVMKFGGTSVEDSTAIDRVEAIVRERLDQ